MGCMNGQTPYDAHPAGLELRLAVPTDLQQLGELLVARGEEGDDVDLQLVVEDSPSGWSSTAVVVDGDRIVSTATLIEELPTLRNVPLPVGQIDLVATDTEYEGRGLVRALMGWAHARSAELGHVAQVMLGIPYFYRRFGYTYAVDIADRRVLSRSIPDADEQQTSHQVSKAALSDIPDLIRLNDAAQSSAEFRMPHTAERWRWIVQQGGSSTWIVRNTAGVAVASGRTTPPDDDVLLAEVTATDPAGALVLLRQAQSLAEDELKVASRPGVAAETWEPLLAAPEVEGEQYYNRVPDVRRLLDAIRPVFAARLDEAGMVLADIPDKQIIVCTFAHSYTIPVIDGRFGPTVEGGAMQSPGMHGAVAIAPDLIGAAIFGPHGLEGLDRKHPDVYAARNGELMRTLFPPVTSDLLTFYLP